MWMPKAIESPGCFGGIRCRLLSLGKTRLSEISMKPSTGFARSSLRIISESGAANWGGQKGRPPVSSPANVTTAGPKTGGATSLPSSKGNPLVPTYMSSLSTEIWDWAGILPGRRSESTKSGPSIKNTFGLRCSRLKTLDHHCDLCAGAAPPTPGHGPSVNGFRCRFQKGRGGNQAGIEPSLTSGGVFR